MSLRRIGDCDERNTRRVSEDVGGRKEFKFSAAVKGLFEFSLINYA